ncbi:MAG: 60 kDa SS-A/Ro ribonucleoprotein [Akkermansiaceae bacterium]|jgi:60 kDa SS-A/Ro ribonucleoprotein
MVHPKPDNAEREAFYAWLIGKPYDLEKLPSPVKEYEAWKITKIGPVPDVPFQMLTALDLGQKEWTEIARNAPWQMTRMNLNTFARHGVFQEKGLDEIIATRLANRAPIKRSRVFPYQLLAAYLNAGAEVPKRVTNALQVALEIATENIPTVPGRVVICPDVSASMQQAVTGNRPGSTSKVRCLDVAALIAAAILRKNPEALVLPFMNDVVKVNLNPHDSIVTNAQKLASLPAGGTNCSAPLKWLNKHRRKADFIFFVSDNESWIDSPNYGWCGGGKTQTMKEWQQIQQRSPKAKMVCLDIQPNSSSQAIERDDIMNIGGFSDQVFEVVSRFTKNELSNDHLVGEIKKIEIRTSIKAASA